jgi:ADP-L-glycero-D-manno-heptose 6-epimerase
MMVVTGGCGFIGSNLVRGLNRRGIDDVVVVDDLTHSEKFSNILDCRITDYRDYQSFLDDLEHGSLVNVEVIFHLGACSDTMETDGRYMMRVNYDYSRRLLEYCVANNVRYIYASSASVYGNGTRFKEIPENEKALNIYAYSKLLFDRHVRQHISRFSSQVVGLRYFNVYGPHEQHKGRMASVAYHFYDQMMEHGCVRLFEGGGGYGHGEQRRDFIWVGDAVDVNLFFMDRGEISGIFNVGSGHARSFNDMARAVVASVSGFKRTVPELIESGEIKYIAFPHALIGKYQSYTQADVEALRAAGYGKEFTPLDCGIQQYVEWRNPD